MTAVRKPRLFVPAFDRATLAAGGILAATLAAGFNPSPEKAAVPSGTPVSYEEDRDGRTWRVVREFEFRRYEIECGGVLVIAEADEIKPTDGGTATRVASRG